MLEKIKKIVDNYPALIAYEINNNHITYQELWNRALEYAYFLKKQGNSPVIIYDDKSINYLITILACLLAKRAYVPLSKQVPINRLLKIIDITNTTLIITESKLDIDNIECCRLNDLVNYQERDNYINDNEIAYIIFTSGSTGEPKGVPINEDNLLNFIDWISSFYPLSSYEEINVLDQASFSFDLSVADFYYSLFNGHTLIAYQNNNCNNNLYNVEFDRSVDYAVVTPTFIKLCLLNEDFNPNNYSRLKCIYFCGETLDKKLVQDLFLDLMI